VPVLGCKGTQEGRLTSSARRRWPIGYACSAGPGYTSPLGLVSPNKNRIYFCVTRTRSGWVSSIVSWNKEWPSYICCQIALQHNHEFGVLQIDPQTIFWWTLLDSDSQLSHKTFLIFFFLYVLLGDVVVGNTMKMRIPLPNKIKKIFVAGNTINRSQNPSGHPLLSSSVDMGWLRLVGSLKL